ncbi:MAG: glycosyltransferase [Candidatus Saccharimonadales bacterium]
MKKKIAIVTCYYQPNYVRAVTLRAAFRAQPDVEVYEIKNKHKGLARYPEVIWKFWRLKRQHTLDAALLTFRGQEILPMLLLLAGRTPLWFDEFIVPGAYARHEKHQRSLAILIKHWVARMGEPLYNFCLRRCAVVLADTQPHAELSAKFSKNNIRKYVAIPVSADEAVFKPSSIKKAEPFQVFYYSSNMQPLHGITYVLDAAVSLQNDPVQFVLVGGKLAMKHAVSVAQKQGANIRYESWLPLKELARTMAGSQLSLGGPFGGTRQAKNVITGKAYQSLASQVVTVVGDGLATNQFFIDHVNCLKVPQKEAAALTEKIRWALSHQDELPKIAAAGRQLYDKEFSIAALARLVRPLVDGL